MSQGLDEHCSLNCPEKIVRAGTWSQIKWFACEDTPQCGRLSKVERGHTRIIMSDYTTDWRAANLGPQVHQAWHFILLNVKRHRWKRDCLYLSYLDLFATKRSQRNVYWHSVEWNIQRIIGYWPATLKTIIVIGKVMVSNQNFFWTRALHTRLRRLASDDEFGGSWRLLYYRASTVYVPSQRNAQWATDPLLSNFPTVPNASSIVPVWVLPFNLFHSESVDALVNQWRLPR